MKALRFLWAIVRWLAAIGLLLVAAYFALQILIVMNVYGHQQSTLGWLGAFSTPTCIVVAAILVAPLSDTFFKSGWGKLVVIALLFAWPVANMSGARETLTPKRWSTFEGSANNSLSYGKGLNDFSIECYPASAYPDTIHVVINKDALPAADWNSADASLIVAGQASRLEPAHHSTYSAYFFTDRSVLQQLASVKANDSVVAIVGAERLELSVGSAHGLFHTFATSCPE